MLTKEQQASVIAKYRETTKRVIADDPVGRKTNPLAMLCAILDPETFCNKVTTQYESYLSTWTKEELSFIASKISSDMALIALAKSVKPDFDPFGKNDKDEV